MRHTHLTKMKISHNSKIYKILVENLIIYKIINIKMREIFSRLKKDSLIIQSNLTVNFFDKLLQFEYFKYYFISKIFFIESAQFKERIIKTSHQN